MELKITKHGDTFYIGGVKASSFNQTVFVSKDDPKKYVSDTLQHFGKKGLRFDSLEKAEAHALKLANDFKKLLEK